MTFGRTTRALGRLRHAHYFKFRTTLTSFRYGISPLNFQRRVNIAIPTGVVMVDGSLTIRTLDDLSRFATGADAVPIVFFARTQHFV